jgi:thioredoxin-dependent peroxiredoxin
MPSLEGKQAPAFSLKGSDGNTHSLKDYAGQNVVLYFYPKDNTPGCTKEACGFRDLHGDLKRKGVVVLGVSKDSLASHDQFIADFKLPFVLLSDPDTAMMKAYGAWGEKLMYGKLVTGTIRSTLIIGPDGRVLKQWSPVKNAEEHPAQVAEFLAGL